LHTHTVTHSMSREREPENALLITPPLTRNPPHMTPLTSLQIPESDPTKEGVAEVRALLV